MTVEAGFSQAGKMLSAAENAAFAQSAQEVARIENGFVLKAGGCTRPHDGPRGIGRKVENRREVDIEAEGADFLADHSAMLAEELRALAGGDLGDRRCGRHRIAQAVDRASLHIDAQKHFALHQTLRRTQQRVSLPGRFDVSREKNNAAGLKRADRGLQAGGEFGAIEAEDKQLTDRSLKILRSPGTRNGLDCHRRSF